MDGDKDNRSEDSFDQIGGPNFADFAKQLQYNNNDDGGYYFPYQKDNDNLNSGTYEFPSSITETVTLPKTTEVTTLFLLDSINRDKTAFPQPTSFTLKLPRLYKNVKSIQLTEVKLLCSFYYFSAIKSNIYLPIIEKGRENITIYNDRPLTELIQIRQGTYGINDLLNEIQTELNYTPLFYDFPNGFNDFINSFSINGDYSVNFNQPGDTYYDSLNSKYIQNPTVNLITSYYWGSRYAQIESYTINQLKVAYYYPVLYEVFLDNIDLSARSSLNLNTPPGLLGIGETPYTHIVFNMSGINDNIALYLINQNISVLDTYRVNHTFRYSLVNRYQVAYDTNSLQVNITTITLNTSLVNLINNTGSIALTTALNKNGLSTQDYSALNNTINQGNIVYTDMFKYIQTQLTNYLGIPFATYSPDFFNNINNIIYFQDGRYATGIRAGYTAEFLQTAPSLITSTSKIYSNSPAYWPNINASNGYKGINSNINTSIIPYNLINKNFEFDANAIDTTSFYFNTIQSSKSVDIIVNILPAQYNIIKFRSPVRQTLQVETLPLPYYYRYSDYNSNGLFKGVLDLNKNNVPQKYFDLSYAFVYTSTNKFMDNSNYSKNLLQTSFGQRYDLSILNSTAYKMNTQLNHLQFEFIAPYPQDITSGIYVNNTSLSMVSMLTGNISTMFSDNFSLFVYHDRAAFMADLLNKRSENPLHYIKESRVNTSNSDVTINFSTFSGHTYYTIFRSDNVSCSNTLIKPVVYYNDSNYTKIKTDYVTFDPNANPLDLSNVTNYPFVTNYNKDFLRLPSHSSISGLNPGSSTFSISLNTKGPPIGYDISGVSNDLTDYIGYIRGELGFRPGREFAIDPLTQYQFQYNTAFDTVNNTYLGSNILNSILEPITNNPYVYKGTSTSQVKIIYWYDGYSIPPQLDDQFTTFNTISTLRLSSINAFTQSYPVDSNDSIQFGRGINAIGFLPTDGVYDVESFSFKSYIYPLSAISTTNEDPNIKIAHIGVFTGLNLVNNNLTLSTAKTVLSFNKSVSYGPNTINRPDFGIGYGTWYDYKYDSSFVSSENVNITGYTPNANELLNYDIMYYMVPFNSQGEVLTYSLLSGNLLPYPLAQDLRTTSSFFGQTSINPRGVAVQKEYFTPEINIGASVFYGPQGSYLQTQSQYEQSMPIATPSIGYKDYSYTVFDPNSLYIFDTIYSTSQGKLSQIGSTTFFTEYSNVLFTVNSISSIISNSNISFQSATYLNSINNLILSKQTGTTDCIYYLENQIQPLQNYTTTGTIFVYNAFTFESFNGDNINITTQSIELNQSMENITLWMWGGGGGTWSNSSNITGGAGAYVKVTINIQSLLNTYTPDAPEGISTIYLVIGKGGNRDNVSFVETIGSLQGYEQPRYGGGGTSVFGNYVDNDSIFLQGGGFSGIFSGSNLLTATPLLIVGGGGAAGTNTLGGPGGFTLETIVNPTITQYNFIDSVCDTIKYNPISIISVKDVFNGSNITSIYDGNLQTFWKPIDNIDYNKVANGIIIKTQDISLLTKIRYYCQSNNPTGFIVYNDSTKASLIYSNTSILSSDYIPIISGSNTYNVYDIIIPTITTSSDSPDGWIVGGTNIQYSINGKNWSPVTNSLLMNTSSIQYVTVLNRWFATGSSIISSADGLNWTISFNPGDIFTSFSSYGITLVAGTNTGKIYTSINGFTWTSRTIFSSAVTKIHFINDIFWAIGPSVQTSTDGYIWTPVDDLDLYLVNDITIGIDRYVIAQSNSFSSSLLFSQDGITWIEAAFLNIDNFNANSVSFGNNVFVAVGNTTDSTSSIKYSIDGINWLNSLFMENVNLKYVKYAGGKFICLANVTSNPGYSVNQLSILTSSDGINWSFIETGGFNPGQSASSISYGPILITPNTQSIYLEIQGADIQVNEIKLYSGNTFLPTNTTSMIDNDLTTVYYPSDQITNDILEYKFILSLQQESIINTMTIIVPNIQSAYFTGLNIYLSDDPLSIIYNNMSILPSSFILTDTYAEYTINFTEEVTIGPLIYITFIKNTAGSIQILNMNTSYISSINYIQQQILQLTDIDNRISNDLLTNIYDADLYTSWSPSTFIRGDTIKLLFTFNQLAKHIDRIKIFTSINTVFSGIFIYTDITKTTMVYSNIAPTYINYLSYGLLDINFPQINNVLSLYIELIKNTHGSPIINGMQFYKNNLISNTLSGYSGGTNVLMNQLINAPSYYDGGGGSTDMGGYAGVNAYNGSYLKGGSASIIPSQISLSNTKQIINGAGGGGGGYYGGGGGGSFSNINGYSGGAGGGGSGYVYSPDIFTVLDYGTGNPGSNYIAPGYQQQQSLYEQNKIILGNVPYGQGGNPDINSGIGANGLIVFSYNFISTIMAPQAEDVIPSYIDGSKLSVFQAPVANNTELRNLSFTSYKDPIEFSQYAGKNWVWYNSYLSLIGCYLTTSMIPNTTIPSFPESFPNLPGTVYLALAGQISSIIDLYINDITTSKVNSITSAIQDAFESFQDIFITISYTDNYYIEMTEIYGLLDYLRIPDNLSNPHINPANPALDRVLGGLPRFGYWANPFITCASYVGFDVSQGQVIPSDLLNIVGSSNQVQAMYGLILEQDLITGKYGFKDVMAYKPTLSESTSNINWKIATQFNESYYVRSLTDDININNDIQVQPYTFKNAITARLPLFKYSVYSAPYDGYHAPIQILNDFEGQNIIMYSFNNINKNNISSVNISNIPITSTVIQMNQTNITQQTKNSNSILGTLVRESISTTVQVVTFFGLDNYIPSIKFTGGSNNYYTNIDSIYNITQLGKAITDMYGNYYFTDNNGSSQLYENISTREIIPQAFSNTNIGYSSPRYILTQYTNGNNNPYSDFFFSKYTNIWHLQATPGILRIYGVRFKSEYDYTVNTVFANQIFYPTHKIILNKKQSVFNTIQDTTDIETYPSQQHTQMFFYSNYTSMARDISGNYAMEKSSNFVSSDTKFSGYEFNSYMYNINLQKSTNLNNDNADSFNYLAIRAYSPSETFQTMVRFYLPQRYDFGYISLKDLSGEQYISNQLIKDKLVNTDYTSFLSTFNTLFTLNRPFGASGLAGYSGSNIITSGFGDFLNKYNKLYAVNTSNKLILSSITGYTDSAINNLITGDLRYILPPYLAKRNRTTDPVEFSIPFSSCVTSSNANNPAYGMGYNLGFAFKDTQFNTVHRATSFFKILDDYIYLQMNEEYNMNRMDISQPENFAQTLNTTAQSGLYNSKLMLNNFGSFATTFVKSPVLFNPPVGKIDKLSFNWYDSKGILLNNNDCEWSGTVQIVESVNIA